MIQQFTNITPSINSAVIAVTGPDACKFLQGQLTCDVAALADGKSTLGAYCNIKGKVESIFTLYCTGPSYLLSLHPDLVPSTLQELKKYAVFSKVKLEALEQQMPIVDDYQEIMSKIPTLYKQTIGMFFPHDLNLYALGAVSFTKGCYRGQEIVARMQHRGNLKRGMYIFNMADVTDIKPGDLIITNENIQAGTVVRICKHEGQIVGLAVLTDALTSSTLHTKDIKISLMNN